jgi:hypothetical protein
LLIEIANELDSSFIGRSRVGAHFHVEREQELKTVQDVKLETSFQQLSMGTQSRRVFDCAIISEFARYSRVVTSNLEFSDRFPSDCIVQKSGKLFY